MNDNERGTGSDPLTLLRAAMRAAPATKWATGVVGLVAAVALILTVVRSPLHAFIGVAALFVAMVALFVFSRVLKITVQTTRPAAVTLMWFMVLVFIATVCCLFMSVFFNWPWPLLQALDDSNPTTTTPFLLFTEVPHAACGETQKLGDIAGEVRGISDPENYNVVVYALTDKWYVQPDVNQPMTRVSPDGSWHNSAYLGGTYVALLVPRAFKPRPVTIAEPQAAEGVIAFAKLDLHALKE
jgi:hypothetical protein